MLDTYRELLATRPLHVVQLVPGIDVVRQRDAGRDKHVFDLWRHLDAELHAGMPRVGLWLDSSALTPAETVERIEVSLDEAIV